MVTCEECGKVNGNGEVGTHWICDDCKVTHQEDHNPSPNENMPKEDQ